MDPIAALPKVIRDNKFAIIDVESTGTARDDEVVQVGIVQVDFGRPGFRAWTYVKPSKTIPAYVIAVHGIDNARVETAPAFADVSQYISELARGRVLLGYNINSFDYPMLQRQFHANGEDFEFPTLDVFPWAKKIDPKPKGYITGSGYHKLANAVVRLAGVKPETLKSHDVLDDCLSAWRLLKALCALSPELANHELDLKPRVVGGKNKN